MNKHESGAAKRAKKRKAEEAALKNSQDISAFFVKRPTEAPSQPREPNAESVSMTEVTPSTSSTVEVKSHHSDVPDETFDILNPTLTNPTDRGHFSASIPSRSLIQEILCHGPCRPPGPFPLNDKNRKFSKSYYSISKQSGLELRRAWLCYSAILDKVYCEPCWLFSNRSDKHFRPEWVNGINDWQHLSQKIDNHEKSSGHISSMLAKSAFTSKSTIDKELESQIETESSYWRDVLRRVFHIILTLTKGNTALRGHNEKSGSSNPGNFLNLVSLLAKFDPLIKSLFENESQKIKYLSPLIQNEIIHIIASALRQHICKELMEAPFFSLIVDSTVDISKIDQASLILRYCVAPKDAKNVEVKESFLGFFEITDQSAAGFEFVVLKILEENQINLDKCRGQGYDGASTMSGRINGLQTRIRSKSENADYVHCAAHNLNLVICDAVKSGPGFSNFFDTLQCIFNFLHASAHRWSILEAVFMETFKINPKSQSSNHSQEHKISLKKLCETRWEARHNSVFAIKFRFNDIIKALDRIILTSKKSDEVNTAVGIKKKLLKYEFVILLVLWEKILKPLKLTSKKLQSVDTDVGSCLKYWNQAFAEIQTMNLDPDGVLKEANCLACTLGIPAQFEKKRKITRKKFFDEIGIEIQPEIKNPEDEFKAKFFEPILSTVLKQMRARFSGIQEIYNNFYFLTPCKLMKLSEEELAKCVLDFRVKYGKDVSSSLLEQILTFVSCMKEDLKKMNTIREIADILIKCDLLDSFPDLYLACILFLTIPVTIASSERSFSKLKILKNYLRNSMSQDRLSEVAILNIESCRTEELDIDKLITRFANTKARRRPII